MKCYQQAQPWLRENELAALIERRKRCIKHKISKSDRAQCKRATKFERVAIH
jgi:hypothetical protein